jgi:hypothetical protein
LLIGPEQKGSQGRGTAQIRPEFEFKQKIPQQAGVFGVKGKRRPGRPFLAASAAEIRLFPFKCVKFPAQGTKSGPAKLKTHAAPWAKKLSTDNRLRADKTPPFAQPGQGSNPGFKT